MHLLGAFGCKMECYLFCNICIIVMQMSKFRKTHMKRLKVSLVRRSSAPERVRGEGGRIMQIERCMLESIYPTWIAGSAGQTILLRMRISSLLGLERSGRLHLIEVGPPISNSPSHFSFPNSWRSKKEMNMQNNELSHGDFTVHCSARLDLIRGKYEFPSCFQQD